MARVRRGRRVDELQRQPPGGLAPDRPVHGARVAGGPSRGPSDCAIDQIRTDHQSQDRQGAWPYSGADAPRPSRRGDRMRRREFIALLGGAAAWPIAASAQQSAKTYRLAQLTGGGTTVSRAPLFAAFMRGMRDLGYVEGQNLV